MQKQSPKRRSLLASLALAATTPMLPLLPAPAHAAEEATGVLRRAAAVMGSDQVRTLRYSAAGKGYTFGQAFVAGKEWPRIDIQEVTRLINYDTASMREEIAFARDEPRGGGGYPATGVTRGTSVVSGTFAWNMAGNNANPNPRLRYDRPHQLWITPHGVIKAAQRHNATLTWKMINGKAMALASFAVPGLMRATAYINADYIVERVDSQFPDFVMGDTPVVTTYSDYREVSGIRFPGKVQQSMGGHPVLDVTVRTIEPNVAADITVPDSARVPVVERVTTEKVAEGVWFIGGGSHNSVAIEMKDHLVLVETPLHDMRTNAVLEAANKLVPGKPVRVAINSHKHFDHAGGVRAAVAAGLTIIAHKDSADYFARVLKTPNSIVPDAMARSGRKPKLVAMTDKHVIRDGTRTIEVHRIIGSDHDESFLMVYLPREKLLIEADAFTPGPAGAPPPATVNSQHVNLINNIEGLKLQVEKILPLHGRIVPVSELYAAARRTPRQ